MCTNNMNSLDSFVCEWQFSLLWSLWKWICSKCGSKDEKIFKEEKPTELLKILSLISNIEKYQVKNID